MLQQPVSRRWCSGGWARQLAGLGRPGNRRTLRQTRPRQSRPVAPHPRPEPWAVPAPDEESQGCQHQAQSRAQSRSSPRNLGRRGRHRCSSPGTCGPGHTCCRGQGEERGVLGAVGFPQPRPCHGLWPQSQACVPDPAGTLPRSCDSVGRPPGGLTWVALVVACFAVGTVVTAGVEALNAVYLALLALPRALGHGLRARAPGTGPGAQAPHGWLQLPEPWGPPRSLRQGWRSPGFPARATSPGSARAAGCH